MNLRRPAGGSGSTAIVALAALLALSCGGARSSTLPTAAVAGIPEPPPKPRVVVISIDGLRPDALAAAGAMNIQEMASRGAATWRAQTILPSTTLPSHASMLSGFPPSAHGITWNDYDVSKGPCRVPTIFAVAHAAGLETVMVVGKEKFKQLDIPGSIDRALVYGPNDELISTSAVVQMSAGFDFMFVHLPETDVAGHRSGWMSPAYMEAVAGADRAVGFMLSNLTANTTVILTADHGGHQQTHGGNAATDVTIPWIAVGPRIQVGKVIQGRVSTVDTAATVAQVLGLSLSPTATGRPVAEAFVAATSGRPMALFVQ